MDDNCNLSWWRWLLEWWGRRTGDEQFGLGILILLICGVPTLLLITLLWHIANLIAGMPPS